VPGPVPVDAKKLIDGLGTIFGGVIQLLAAMEPGMAKELADMAINGVLKETAPEEINPDDFEEIISADDLPWDTEPEQAEQQEAPKEPPKKKAAPKKKQEQTTLTADDLIRVVTQKIKKDRSNKVLHDSAFDLASYIASRFGVAMGNAEERAFFIGDGDKKPLGILDETGGA
jgi:hypothetical protein